MKNNNLSEKLEKVLVGIECFAEKAKSVQVSSPDDFRRKWSLAAEAGLTGIVIPVEFGGLGLGAEETCIVLEHLGLSHDDAGFNFALAAHLLACVQPLVQYADQDQATRLFPGIVSGQLIMANAMTEEASGSAAYRMSSIAETSPNGFLLSGHKTYCSNAPVADLFLTYAMSNQEKGAFGGITAFLTDREKHNFNVGPTIEKAGLASCFLAKVTFSNLPVEECDILGEAGGGTSIFQESMNWERICLGALHIGEMNRLFENAVNFINHRKPGGVAIGKHQSVSHPLARLNARMAAGRALMLEAAAKLDAGVTVANEAAMTKLVNSEIYRDFALQLHQVYGGAAFHAGHPAAECLANAAAATIYSGTSEIQCNIITRYLGIR